MSVSKSASPADCSVVVIALAGNTALETCLHRLQRWHGICHVILGEDMGDSEAWAAQFPTVRFSEGRGLTVPMRRQRGVETAQRQLVALLEDTSLPEHGWLEAVCDAFIDDKVAAAGGPVWIDAALAPRCQALACTEYGRFHPARFPQLAVGTADARGTQAVSRLPGNNLVYRRALVQQILASVDHGLLEVEVNEILKAGGFSLALQPRMAVTYAAADPIGIRLGVRAQHGRLFASQRSRAWSYPRRLAWGVASMLLPAVLTARSLAGMVHAVRPAAWLPTALWILLMESAWAFGEGIGYLAGAGRSLDAWR